jgi:hypothetical protein
VSDGQPDGFEALMRRHFAGIDTSPGFEARLAGRIAAMRMEPADVLRARVERRLELVAQRLRREAWMNAANAVGIGAAAIALVWRHGPSVARRVEDLLAAASDPQALMGAAAVVLALGLWPALRRFLPR